MNPPSLEGFRHHTAIQVRWGDMDALGHVNNAAFLTYLEQARVGYFAELGLWDGSAQGVGLIMARVEMDFRLPLFAGDDVHVFTRCARLGNRSFDTVQQIVRRTSAGALEVAAPATITIVVFDYAAGHSVGIPDTWRRSLREYEPWPPAESRSV